MRELVSKYKEIICYLIVGVLTTIVSLGTYYICVTTFLDPKDVLEIQVANIISWIIAVSFAYVANRIFVFESKEPNILREILKFFSARIGSLGIEMMFMFVTVTMLCLDDKIMKIAVQVVIVVTNYVLSKMYVFKKRK